MSVVGPIASSLSDLRFVFNAIVNAEPWFSDPKCIELPWRPDHLERVKGRALSFGLIKWDTIVMPHPPVQRGLRMVESALRSHGHEIIEFAIPDPHEVNSLTVNSS